VESDSVQAEVARLRDASDADLAAQGEELARKRTEWFTRFRIDNPPRHSDPLDEAYAVILSKLGISPAEAPIVLREEGRIVFHSRNECPTLEACRILGLDTRRVCRSSERAMEELIRQVDPRLRFRRNYDRLRPRAQYCEEMIEREG
jgi:tRNA(adenine34) deaminase